MLQLKSKEYQRKLYYLLFRKTVIPIVVEIEDNIFKLAKTRPNILFLHFLVLKQQCI